METNDRVTALGEIRFQTIVDVPFSQTKGDVFKHNPMHNINFIVLVVNQNYYDK